jgi:hypothetical protein
MVIRRNASTLVLAVTDMEKKDEIVNIQGLKRYTFLRTLFL